MFNKKNISYSLDTGDPWKPQGWPLLLMDY